MGIWNNSSPSGLTWSHELSLHFTWLNLGSTLLTSWFGLELWQHYLNGHIKEEYIWHKNLECQITGLSLTQKRGLKKSYPLCAPQTKTKLKGDLYCKLCKLKNYSVEDCFHLDKTPCGSCRKYGHAAKECYGKGQKRTNNAKIKGSDKVTPKKCNKKEAHQATKTNEATYVAFAAIEAEENDMEGEFNYNMQSQVRNTIMI